MGNATIKNEKKSKKGDKLVRSMSNNGMLGVYIGADTYHFSEDIPEPDIEITLYFPIRKLR